MHDRASLLLANGHPAAKRYPLWMVSVEAARVRKRINNQMATQSMLDKAAMTAVMATGNGIKKANQHYGKLIRRLTDGE